jgi:hypothetical protein
MDESDGWRDTRCSVRAASPTSSTPPSAIGQPSPTDDGQPSAAPLAATCAFTSALLCSAASASSSSMACRHWGREQVTDLWSWRRRAFMFRIR